MSKERNEIYVEFMNKVFSKSTKEQREALIRRIKVADKQLSYHEKSRSKNQIKDVM